MGPHIPYLLMQRNRAVKIQHMISPHDAVHIYRMSGGKLTQPDDISDPLLDNSPQYACAFIMHAPLTTHWATPITNFLLGACCVEVS